MGRKRQPRLDAQINKDQPRQKKLKDEALVDFGVIGLGRMGGGLALQALAKKFKVAGVDPGKVDDSLQKHGLDLCESHQELVGRLKQPRIIFLYVHSGSLVDSVIDELKPLLSDGDIIVDGGNSYWGDSIIRANRMKEGPKKVHFVDCGTSGGINAAKTGACFMCGGESTAVQRIEPILKQLCVPGGFCYVGQSGSGHFVKLVQ
jgi:6-phosphogluconate dehydrogenase